MMDNLYMPYLMRIERITYEAPGVKTFMLKFVDEAGQEKFTYKAGQFMVLENQLFALPLLRPGKVILNAHSDRLERLPTPFQIARRGV